MDTGPVDHVTKVYYPQKWPVVVPFLTVWEQIEETIGTLSFKFAARQLCHCRTYRVFWTLCQSVDSNPVSSSKVKLTNS